MFLRLTLRIMRQDTTISDNIRGKRKRGDWNASPYGPLVAGFSRGLPCNFSEQLMPWSKPPLRW